MLFYTGESLLATHTTVPFDTFSVFIIKHFHPCYASAPFSGVSFVRSSSITFITLGRSPPNSSFQKPQLGPTYRNINFSNSANNREVHLCWHFVVLLTVRKFETPFGLIVCRFSGHGHRPNEPTVHVSYQRKSIYTNVCIVPFPALWLIIGLTVCSLGVLNILGIYIKGICLLWRK